MMLFHHMAGFPERIVPGFPGFETLWSGMTERGILPAFAGFCNTCVSLFFFLGGYGLYLKWKAQRFHLWKQIKQLYKAYWRVLVLIVPVALLFFRRSDPDLLIIHRLYNFHELRPLLVSLLGNFSGYSSSLNLEWWFFKAYLCMLPMGVLFCHVTKKSKNPVINLLIVCLLDFLRRVVLVNLASTTVFANAGGNAFYANFLMPDFRAVMLYLGIVFAKHDLLVKFKKEYSRLRFSPLYGAVTLLLIFYLRSYVVGDSIDIICIPIFIIAVSVVFDGIPLLKKGFVFFGKRSTNIWLLHTFFCYYFYECAKMVYATRSPLIDWLILLAMTLCASLAVDGFWKIAGRFSPQLRKIFLKPEPKTQNSQ